jgi:thioesterase domain-containing protein
VVTLSGWSLLWCLLDEYEIAGKIVIQDSAIQYLLPVAKDFAARCCLPEEAQVTRFLKILGSKRRVRIELHAEIWEDQRLAVRFTGRYVVDALKGNTTS